MTVKEQAHLLVDQLPDHATWEDLLERLKRVAGGVNAAGSPRSGNAASDPTARELELRRFLEREVWPQIPASVLGKPLTKGEREAILGYGPAGV